MRYLTEEQTKKPSYPGPQEGARVPEIGGGGVLSDDQYSLPPYAPPRPPYSQPGPPYQPTGNQVDKAYYSAYDK